ncbi:MAG: hypothetical protein MJA82_20995 [Clostridia bacterium]|nr:hypothetical protein [Clostridia bacterium]
MKLYKYLRGYVSFTKNNFLVKLTLNNMINSGNNEFRFGFKDFLKFYSEINYCDNELSIIETCLEYNSLAGAFLLIDTYLTLGNKTKAETIIDTITNKSISTHKIFNEFDESILIIQSYLYERPGDEKLSKRYEAIFKLNNNLTMLKLVLNNLLVVKSLSSKRAIQLASLFLMKNNLEDAFNFIMPLLYSFSSHK